MRAEIGVVRVESPGHCLPGHPERPGRFELLDLPGEWAFSSNLVELDAKQADEDALLQVHPSSYLQYLGSASPGFLDGGDTYSTQDSLSAAKVACGGVAELVTSVCDGELGAGFALIRPPGHHATRSKAMGFCLINNIAVAVRRAQKLGHGRVLILDIDVHHGNGTEEIFLEDPSVMFISTHQWGIYPGTGAMANTGTGEGTGFTCNLPLPSGAGDEGYARLTEQVILPLSHRFAPDLIMVSCGFDAHWRDPLASLQLSLSGYHRLAAAFQALANDLCEGRIVYVLEGGYDPRVVADGVVAVLHGLSSHTYTQDPLGPAPHAEPSLGSLIEQARALHEL